MIGWLLQALVGVTLVMILLLALRRPVAHFLGAEWAYALWILPPLRLVIPPSALPQSPVSAELLPASLEIASSADLAALAFGWPGLMAALWLGGAALYLSWQQSSYDAFLLHLGPEGSSGEPPDFGGIRVVVSAAVDGPMAVGIWRKRIVVPPDFATRYSLAEQQLALEHELVHHRRFDIVWNLVALLFLALNWFNPVAHFAFRAFRADQELACDAVVARRCPRSRCDYARALVKSASQSRLLTAAPLNHAAFLKRRLRMMHRHGGSRLRTSGGIAVLVATTAGGLVLSSPSQAVAQQESTSDLRLAAAATSYSAVQPAGAAGNQLIQRCSKQPESRVARIRKAVETPVEKVPSDFARVEVAMRDPEIVGSFGAEIEAVLQEAEGQLAAAALQRAHAAEMADRVRRQVLAEAPIRAAIVRQAVDRARARLAEFDLRAARLAALDKAALAMEIRATRMRIGHRQYADMKLAIAEARREIELADAAAEMEHLQAEVDRDIAKELERALEDPQLD